MARARGTSGAQGFWARASCTRATSARWLWALRRRTSSRRSSACATRWPPAGCKPSGYLVEEQHARRRRAHHRRGSPPGRRTARPAGARRRARRTRRQARDAAAADQPPRRRRDGRRACRAAAAGRRARGASRSIGRRFPSALQAFGALAESLGAGARRVRVQPRARRADRCRRARRPAHPRQPAPDGANACAGYGFRPALRPAVHRRRRARRPRKSRSATAFSPPTARPAGPTGCTRCTRPLSRSTACRPSRRSPKSPAASTICWPASRRPAAPNWSGRRPGAARFVHVVSGGFGETGEGGATLEQELLQAARVVGRAAARAQLHGHLQPARPAELPGRSARGGRRRQRALAERRAHRRCPAGGPPGRARIRPPRVDRQRHRRHAPPSCSTGSSTIPQTEIIGLYLEGLAGGERLVRALRRADGRKPVVLLVGGTSAQGSRAVASHTGAMATDAGIWKAIARAAGVTLVSSLEDLIGCLAYLQRWAAVPSGGAGARRSSSSGRVAAPRC